MLRSDTLFGKREAATPNTPLNSGNSAAAQNPSGAGFHAKPASPTNTNFNSPATSQAPAPSTNEVGSKLIVGPNIKLKGVEITDCDTLVVEGFVEATMDSRVIQIAKDGSFKGSAGIDIAEIHGTFDGELTVRQKLVIYASGKVSGKIRYGNVVIEEGGQLMGDVQVGAATPPKGLTVAKSV